MHHIKPIITKHGGKQVQGKGFSPNEMKAAGVNKNQMRKMGMPIDYKRKSEHAENVEAIKAHAAQIKA
jgi:ribosomal protein L13E